MEQAPAPALDHAVARERAMRFLVTIRFADTVPGVCIGGEAMELLALFFESAFSEGVQAGIDVARQVVRTIAPREENQRGKQQDAARELMNEIATRIPPRLVIVKPPPNDPAAP